MAVPKRKQIPLDEAIEVVASACGVNCGELKLALEHASYDEQVRVTIISVSRRREPTTPNFDTRTDQSDEGLESSRQEIEHRLFGEGDEIHPDSFVSKKSRKRGPGRPVGLFGVKGRHSPHRARYRCGDRSQSADANL